MNRQERAESLMRRLERGGVWVFTNDRGTVSVMARGPAKALMTTAVLQKLQELNQELVSLVEDRRRDGTIDSVLLVFLDDVRAVTNEGTDSVCYKRGDLVVLEEPVARPFVELGFAVEHPGPA